MHPRTVQALDQLEKANWFSHVGIKDTETVFVLSTWQEAMNHCGAPGWAALNLEAANQYRERLVERSMERFRQWNVIAKELRSVIDPFVTQKIETVVREQNLPKVFGDCVRWDVAHLCMECEYADVYPPGFFASHAYWYMRGHFPRGWQGKFPNNGSLIVF